MAASDEPRPPIITAGQGSNNNSRNKSNPADEQLGALYQQPKMPTSLYNLMLQQGFFGWQDQDGQGGYGDQLLTASMHGAYAADPYGRFKNAATIEYDKWADGREVFALTDPYMPADKFRFEDAYRADGMVRRCINLIVKYALGRRTKNVIDITEEFAPAAAEDRAAALNDYLSDQEQNQIITFVDSVNRKVNFHPKVQAAFTQSKVGGRAALLIQSDAQGVPENVKILNWKKLGTVYIDKDTWEFLGVGYADLPEGEVYEAKHLIYFVNHDYHITPDSFLYGLSDLEPVMHVSETNRMLNEIDIKEGARSGWAPSGLIRFKSDISAEDARRFVRRFMPGTLNSTTHEIELHQFDLKLDFNALIGARDANDRYIARVLNVPNPLIGFEAITNRATLQSILEAWQDSDLANDRTMLQNVLEPQWLNKLLAIKYSQIKKLKEPIGLKGYSSLLPVKIKLEFENITFNTLEELAKAVVPLREHNLITTKKAAQILGFDDIEDELVAEEDRTRIAQETEHAAKIELEREKVRGGLQMQQQNQNAQLQMATRFHNEMLTAARMGAYQAQQAQIPQLKNILTAMKKGSVQPQIPPRQPSQQQQPQQTQTPSKLDLLRQRAYEERIAVYLALKEKLKETNE